MSDEQIVETTEATSEVEKPALSKEDIAAALGVDVSDLDKLGKLKTWERDLNRTSSELGAFKKAQETKKADEDDVPELDESSKKALRKYLTDTIGVDIEALAYAANFAKSQTVDSLQETVSDFFAANKDFSEDEIFGVLQELPAMPTDLKAKDAKKLLGFAKDIVAFRRKAKEPEADKVIEKAEELIEAKSGEQVVSVKKKATPHDAKKSLEDLAAEEGNFWDKIAAFSS